MADSISAATDTQLVAIATQAHSIMSTSMGAYPGITAAMLTELETRRDDFDADLTAHIATQAQAKSKTETKNIQRGKLEDELRKLRNIAKAGGADSAAMAGLGIPAAESGAPPSATIPIVKVDTSERLRHTVAWNDADTPNNKKKPIGTMGAEIWVKVDGPPPGNEAECTFLSLDAFTPYLAEYDAADAGKNAHYMLRWRMRDGSVGAWSETVSATITA